MRLLAVSPTARNAGIGRALIEECERRARQAGAGAITLHTTHLMSVAKAMYERRNYERYPSIDFEPVPGFLVMGFKKNLDH
jgi:ribosomal protein S18 acetylase RimI-like enzyme